MRLPPETSFKSLFWFLWTETRRKIHQVCMSGNYTHLRPLAGNCLSTFGSEAAKALVVKPRNPLFTRSFNMRQWVINNSSVLSHLPADNRSTSSDLWRNHGQPYSYESTFGLDWHCPLCHPSMSPNMDTSENKRDIHVFSDRSECGRLSFLPGHMEPSWKD